MKIVLSTGGSGGHIFPALSVAEELKKNHHDVIIVSTAGQFLEKIRGKGFECRILDVKGLSFDSVKSFGIFFVRMLKAIYQRC